jgi:hypothetical protein
MAILTKISTLAAILQLLSISASAQSYNQQIARGGEAHESRGGEHSRDEEYHHQQTPNRPSSYNKYNDPNKYNEAGKGAAYERGYQNAASTSGGSVYVSPEDAYNPYAPNSGNPNTGDSWSQ